MFYIIFLGLCEGAHIAGTRLLITCKLCSHPWRFDRSRNGPFLINPIGDLSFLSHLWRCT